MKVGFDILSFSLENGEDGTEFEFVMEVPSEHEKNFERLTDAMDDFEDFSVGIVPEEEKNEALTEVLKEEIKPTKLDEILRSSISKNITKVLVYYESAHYVNQAKELFPEEIKECHDKWVNRFSKGFVRAWEKMDYNTRRTYIQNALDFHETLEA